MLYLVSTPIGNLKDITLRALETLKEVNGIICEDTRRTSLLLSHYEIKKPLFILNDFNEARHTPSIIERLRQGENLALVSDAGAPLVSDPGYKLVREALEQKIPVDCIPGATSIIPALSLSGLPPDKFSFLGFFPDKGGPRQKLYESMKKSNEILPTTFILFVSPYKLIKTIQEISETFGDINITLAKELTKIHQAVTSKKTSEWLEYFKKTNPKGEWIMLINLNR